MPTETKPLRKSERSLRARSSPRNVQTALADLAHYLEEEKLKVRREVSQEINQWLLPLLQKFDKNPGAKSDLANLLQRKLDELAAGPASLVRRTLSQLSPAEWQVCQLLRQGHRTKDIAESLNLSPSTIENQRNAIRRKLGLAHSENLVTFLQQL